MAISSVEFARLGGLGLVVQLVVRREAGLALRLAGLRRHPHPLEFTGERALSCFVASLLALEPFLLLLQPAGVVALEGEALAAIEFEDPLGDVVEEVPVVGDGDDRAGVVTEEPLEPVDRLGVEVVGRLVEQQQVGARQQEPTQRDASTLAA